MPTLGAPGGSLASGWHDRGTLHGRARAELAQGIGPGGRGESGSEVTGQEMDGGVLTLLGCPRWSWRWPGRRGVAHARSLQGGAGLGVQQEWRSPIGGWLGRAEGRGRGVLAGFGLGLPFLPSIQPDTTRVNLWQDFVLGFEKICW
jgi:hypothetical protein